MSLVLVNHLNIRTGPSKNAEKVGYFDAGQKIGSYEALIENEGQTWLKFRDAKGHPRYVCVLDTNKERYVSLPVANPGPGGNKDPCIPPSQTGIPGIPKLSQFPDNRLKNYGDCFLCTCVKGGLTTLEQCMDCFNWGLESGKLRNSDCYVNCNKEEWAKEISSKYGTTYHEDYVFQKSNRPHFLITQNGKEIFNPYGLGWQ